MLNLGITEGEWITIGEARIKLYRSDHGRLRIAIDAPRHITVVRASAGRKEPNSAFPKPHGGRQ